MSAPLRIALAAATLGAGWLSPVPASANVPAADACARHAPEAAARSGLPPDVIMRVMHAESRGRPRAVSHKGAMGCMQIMPQTWAYLTRRYGLGGDPFESRMNMIGGALYLADLAGQFGFPGAYSAYNAGPGRYLRYVRRGAALPAETVAYTAQITGSSAVPVRVAASGQQPALRWQEAGLFLVSSQAQTTGSATKNDAVQVADDRASGARTNGLFPLSRSGDTP